jgi:ankyrin repeat protein
MRDIARLLLTCDANVTAQDGRGMTPLHFASRAGRWEITGILLERGADVVVQGEYSTAYGGAGRELM